MSGAISRYAMLALVVIVVGFALVESLAIFPARLCDFRAFYCSGRAVLAGQDPYREHPLHECEHAVPGPLVSDLPAELTIPAPYPGYALVLFALVAKLPFNLAVGVWTVCSCAALGASIVLVARLTGTPVLATTIVLGFPAGVISLPLGQPTTLVLAAIAGCAALLQAGRPRGAAVAAAISLLDPHVGLALCVALFAAFPRLRTTLVAVVATLAAASVVVVGPARELEYVREVLPAHALVNVPEFSQFSAANFAYSAGLSPAHALVLGDLWYAAAIVVGTLLAGRLRATFGPAVMVFVPIAFAVFGGNHTHLQQLDLALPAFLLLTSSANGVRRAALVCLTFLALVPWLISAASPPQFLAIALLGVAFSRLMRTPMLGPVLALSSLLLLIGICAAIVGAHATNVAYAAPVGNPLAEVSWGRFVMATSVPTRVWYILGKLPTVLAFLSLFVLLVRAASAAVDVSLPPAAQPAGAVGG